MTRNGHTLEYMDFLKRLGINAKPKNQLHKAGIISFYDQVDLCLAVCVSTRQ